MVQNKSTARLICLSLILFFLPLVVFSDEGHAEFDDIWVNPDEPLTLTIPQSENGSNQHAIFIDNSDVTALFSPIKPGVYVYQSQLFPLKSGEQQVVVYLIDENNQWTETGVYTLKVLSPSGFEESEVNLSATVTVDSRWDGGVSGSTPAPNRNSYHDGSLQASLQTRQASNDFEITTSTNIVGSTFQENTLQFGEKGGAAPKVDLSDYLVEVRKGDAGLSVGHVSYSSNPLILADASNRGIVATYRVNDYLDVGMTTQNGTSIVGFDNFLGIKNSGHYISGGTLGLEIFPETPGDLRVEVSYVDARIESLSDFGFTEVTDAEKSRGWGLRILGETLEGRLRYDGSYARSRFTNPLDPFLDQGFGDVVAVTETTDNAYLVTIDYDLFTDLTIGESTFVTATLTFTTERTDPLYRSLVASPQADLERSSVSLQASVGVINFSLGYSESEDNIDDLVSILKTRTEDWTSTIDLPLYEFWGDADAEIQYWPSVSIALERVHQFAINIPVNGGFSAGHLPDQMNDNVNINASWNFSHWDFGYDFTYSNQDNRQVGRTLADFKTYGNSINIGLRPLEALSVSFSIGRINTKDREQAIRNLSDTGTISVDWQTSENLSFSGSFNRNYDHDSQLLAKSLSDSFDLNMNYQFELPLTGGVKTPGQLFVRYSNQDSKTRDSQFGFNSDAGSWVLTSGISVSF